jgi:serine/threonine protein kinase/Tol biopolymer transport system component
MEGLLLMIGKTLAHYEITSQLGKGGMGEVYQAKDLKLGRDVAIKVLPEEFAKDADRVARFQREAKVLASLNHPNIAAIHGLEESNGTNFLVLELVEGDTLADQLKRGPIPVEESLKLAFQIAEALEAAHEKGVIHRDLKPANIKVTSDGKVKVLDFGLAKAYAGEREEMMLSNSPTLSVAATRQGLILGTAAYMSPEQAKGKTVDKRADIWAFGAVLFEMLTGKPAFPGEEVSEILASVIKGDSNLNLLPPNIHQKIREVLSRCLQKDLRKRYHDIADVRCEIEQILADPSGVFAGSVDESHPQAGLKTFLPWLAAALVMGAIIAGVAVWKLKPPESRQVIRFEYELPEGQQFSDLNFGALAVSPDGRQFVYSTTKGLFLRSIDELTAKLVAGTEGSVMAPFFSPDGKWVGYFSGGDGQLKKISISGGTPVTLCAVPMLLGAFWSADNTIVFGNPSGAIMRVSAGGGTPVSILKADFRPRLFPQILPDRKSLLYSRGPAPRMIVVQSLESGESKELFAGSYARYLPTGHIYYKMQNNSNAFAVPFDIAKLEVTGDPVPVVEGVRQGEPSDSGTLVYIPSASGVALNDQRSLVWVDRNGKEEPIGAPLNLYRFPSISPDGTKVAITVIPGGGENNDVWVWDLARKTLTRLTFEGRNNLSPVWTPDGKRIAFSRIGTASGIYWKAADGTGKDEQLCSLSENRMFFPYCWSSDGKTLVGAESQGLANSDIVMLSMEGDHPRKPLLQESYEEGHPKISPDGRWIAYTSDESRRSEVYVRSFPDVNKGRWQVSTNGGGSPLWSPDGHELFYRSGDAVMAVSVETEPGFSIMGTPRVLFRGTYVRGSVMEGTPWDISPDGKRFLMLKPAATGAPEPAAAAPRPKINIVINWFEDLKRLVPTSK